MIIKADYNELISCELSVEDWGNFTPIMFKTIFDLGIEYIKTGKHSSDDAFDEVFKEFTVLIKDWFWRAKDSNQLLAVDKAGRCYNKALYQFLHICGSAEYALALRCR